LHCHKIWQKRVAADMAYHSQISRSLDRILYRPDQDQDIRRGSNRALKKLGRLQQQSASNPTEIDRVEWACFKLAQSGKVPKMKLLSGDCKSVEMDLVVEEAGEGNEDGLDADDELMYELE